MELSGLKSLSPALGDISTTLLAGIGKHVAGKCK